MDLVCSYRIFTSAFPTNSGQAYWCTVSFRAICCATLPSKNSVQTRKSSCVNARGIPPAVYWVLLLLSYLGTPPPQAGYPPRPDLAEEGGQIPDQGTPQQGNPPPHFDLAWGGTWPGYPLAGYPPAGPGRVPPLPAGPARVPPPRCLPHGILGNVAKHYGIWVPLPLCGQTDWWKDRCMSKHYLSVILRTRAVIINWSYLARKRMSWLSPTKKERRLPL